MNRGCDIDHSEIKGMTVNSYQLFQEMEKGGNMSRIIFLLCLSIAAGIFVLGPAQAYADAPDMSDDLVYEYYNVIGPSNYMIVASQKTVQSGAIPLPSGKNAFTYTPVEIPAPSEDPATARPIGVGSVANGGGTLHLQVEIGPFEEPVDVTLGFFAASFDAADIYFLNIFNELTSLQEEINQETSGEEENHDGLDDNPGSGNKKGKKKYKKLAVWKSDVLEVNESLLGPIDLSEVSPGLYVLVLNVTRVSPADNNFDRFYRWVTYFIIPDPEM
jgi:hypothetical protein